MEEKRMTFGEHLEELRKRLLKCLLILAAAMGLSLFFQEQLMDFITAPHRKAITWLNRNASDQTIAAKLGSATISLNERDAPIKDVIEKIRLAAGFPIRYDPDVKPLPAGTTDTVTVTVERAPLMTALKATLHGRTYAMLWTNNELWITTESKAEKEFQTHPYDARLLAGTYPAVFMNYMKLALIIGLVVASPFIVYQIWKFISAGLYPHEKKYVNFYGPVSLALFLIGCAFAYLVLIPWGLMYLASYGDPVKFELKFFLSDYLSLVLMMIFIMGIFFELPLVMLFFSTIGLVSPQAYARWRKFAIVAIFVVGAILTPPDVVSQCLMSIPLCLLYELGIIMARVTYRKKPA